MIMVSISLVMSVIVTNIYLRKDTQTRVPRCLRRLFLGDVVAKPAGCSVPPPPPPPTSNGNLRGQTASSDVWTVGGQDRHDVELAGHGCRVVDSFHLNDDEFDVFHRRLAPLSHDLAHYPDTPHRRAHRLGSARDNETTEWQDLARIIDRLFFWLFMVSSVGILTALYMSVAQRNASTDDNVAP